MKKIGPILIFLTIFLIAAQPGSSKLCSLSSAKEKAIAHYSKRHKGSEFDVFKERDTLGYFYISIGPKGDSITRRGDFVLITTVGSWHYYFEKSTCRLERLVKEQ